MKDLLIYSLCGFFLGILLTFIFLQRKIDNLSKDKVALETKLNAQTSLEEVTKDFSEKILKDLHKDSEDFFSKKSANIESILTPMRESLAFFQQNLKQFEMKQAEDRGSLKEQISQLISMNTALKSETQSLSSILKHPANRGRWGEVQLERLLEVSGMLKYCDFSTQHVTVDKSRPDILIHLPNNRCIVIDAKVPLSEDYFSHNEEITKKGKEDLILKIKTQIRNLQSKNYSKQFAHSPEFVVLFLPGEGIFYDLLHLSPQLFEDAAKQNVIICTPSNLLALLKTIAYTWKQENLHEQIQTIKELGKTFYERFQSILKHFSSLRKNLNQFVVEYNQVINSINQRLFPVLRQFEQISLYSETEDLPKVDAHTVSETFLNQI